MNKNNLFGIGILLAVLLAFTAPATARTDNVTFYLNASDGSSHEVNVIPGEETTIYLDLYAPINKTGGFEVAVMFDPDVLECLDITENASVTDWMLWTFRGVWDNAVDPDLHYMNFDSLHFNGIGPGLLRCGDMRVRGVNPGMTTLYLGVWPDDVLDGNNRSSTADEHGDPKDWDDMVELTFTCVGPDKTFTKPLASGWNLVSLPLIADDMTAGSVLAPISGLYTSVMRYDSSAHSFVAVTDTDTMGNGVGYFINMTSAGTWSYDGQPCNSISETLSTGLNCVGWTNKTDSALPGALSSIDGSYRYVARWNADDRKYEVYLPGAPDVFNDFDTMDRGEGRMYSTTSTRWIEERDTS
jgi:hypothetical protein